MREEDSMYPNFLPLPQPASFAIQQQRKTTRPKLQDMGSTSVGVVPKRFLQLLQSKKQSVRVHTIYARKVVTRKGRSFRQDATMASSLYTEGGATMLLPPNLAR
jgi:hypothetical protein